MVIINEKAESIITFFLENKIFKRVEHAEKRISLIKIAEALPFDVHSLHDVLQNLTAIRLSFSDNFAN